MYCYLLLADHRRYRAIRGQPPFCSSLVYKFLHTPSAMGHRHMFNTPRNIETDSDPGWDNAQQPYMPRARPGASASGSLVYPGANTTIPGGRFSSQWNPTPRSSGVSSSMHNSELPNYHRQAPGPSRDPFLYHPAAENFHMLQDNYSHYQSSSNLVGQTVAGLDGGFYDHRMSSARRPQKRKSPDIPPVTERGSTSRYYDVGSSSNLHLPADPWQEKRNTESFHTPWEYPPSYGANHLSIGNEGMLRNVRSRVAIDSETSADWTQLSSNSLRRSVSVQSSDQCNSVDIRGQNFNAATSEPNRGLLPPAGQRVTSGSDSSFFSQDLNSQYTQNYRPSGSFEIGSYYSDLTSNRAPVSQNVNNNLNQPVRGVQIGYDQRSVSTFGASSSNFRPGHMASSDEGVHMVAENYPSRHPRALPSIRWRNVNRSARTLISSDRRRSFTEAADFRDRLTPEGLMIMDHTAFYGTGTLFDLHRDMRLDVDNMSYEELLALGERIGNVSTGLSDSLISNCLIESIYCSPDLLQNDGSCVICLEEYKNMDNVGTLKVCGHGFHVSCIRKWLSIKSLCPICKSSAMKEGAKDE